MFYAHSNKDNLGFIMTFLWKIIQHITNLRLAQHEKKKCKFTKLLNLGLHLCFKWNPGDTESLQCSFKYQVPLVHSKSIQFTKLQCILDFFRSSSIACNEIHLQELIYPPNTLISPKALFATLLSEAERWHSISCEQRTKWMLFEENNSP